MPNPHPSIFPKLIRLWNEAPVEYLRFMARWGIPNDEANLTYLLIIQRWIDESGHGEFLNG